MSGEIILTKRQAEALKNLSRRYRCDGVELRVSRLPWHPEGTLEFTFTVGSGPVPDGYHLFWVEPDGTWRNEPMRVNVARTGGEG